MEWMIAPPARATLRSLAAAADLSIGAAVAVTPLRNEVAYAETLGREFNMLTAENAMKFGPLRPGRETYAFDDADTIIAFAKQHAMQVRGHTLLWHRMLPRWLNEGTFTRQELQEILREHIFTVAGRYRG